MAYAPRASRWDYPMTVVMNVLLMSGGLAALGAALVRAHGAPSGQAAALVVLYAILTGIAGLSACALMQPRAKALQTLMLIANCFVVTLAVCAVMADTLVIPFRAIAWDAGTWVTIGAGVVNSLTLCSVLRADARLALP